VWELPWEPCGAEAGDITADGEATTTSPSTTIIISTATVTTTGILQLM
jgi:hypothetical protein